MSTRPKKPTPDVRIIAATSVIFAKPPVPWPPGLQDELHDAVKASHDGIERHRPRTAGTDWQSVVRAVTAAGKGEALRAPIRAAAIRAVLAEFSPNHVTLAPAFIKWLRRPRRPANM